MDAANSSGIGLDAVTPNGSSWITAKNRLNLSAVSYDRAGNLLALSGSGATYDAENRLASLSSTFSYSYDGDGRRAKKVNGGVTTKYVYDAFGQLSAEYTTATPSASSCTTCYVLADHLGSTRALWDTTGVRARFDYMPFGELIPVDRNNRSGVSCAAGVTSCYSGAGSLTVRFTGKERDGDTANSGMSTGLDWFDVRYMSSAQGRFGSPDPLMWQVWQNGSDDDRERLGEFIGDPQNLNLYAYVRNNPLRYTDPTGTYYCVGKDDQCAKIKAAYNEAEQASRSKDLSAAQRAELTKILKFLGKPGEVNGVVVAFGQTQGGSIADANTHVPMQQVITTITFNPRALARFGADVLGGVLIHEGTHGLNDFPNRRNPSTAAEELATERNAYRNESYVHQALKISLFGLWSPTWPADQIEKMRRTEIERGAQRSLRVWCQGGGRCR